MTWSIVTVTYNSADSLRHSWGAWHRNDYANWIVVDNASEDDSVEVATELGAQVIKLHKNVGFGAANNIGLAIFPEDEFVLFANPDLRVDSRGLKILENNLREEGGLAAPQLTNPDGTRQPNGRGFPTIWNKVKNRILKTDHADYQLTANPGETRPVCFAIGAAIAGARQEFELLRGWDDRFFIYYEDSDICIREWLRGGKVILVGEARWEHQWARETLHFRMRPWIHEIASMIKFYSMYPELLSHQPGESKRFHNLGLELLDKPEL